MISKITQCFFILRIGIRSEQKFERSSEWSDGIYQRRHNHCRPRTRKWSPSTQPHPQHRPRHGCGFSSFFWSSIPEKFESSGLKLPQERYPGELAGPRQLRGCPSLHWAHVVEDSEGPDVVKETRWKIASSVDQLSFLVSGSNIGRVGSDQYNNVDFLLLTSILVSSTSFKTTKYTQKCQGFEN